MDSKTKLNVRKEASDLIWSLCERNREYVALAALKSVTIDDDELRDAGHLALANGLAISRGGILLKSEKDFDKAIGRLIL